MATLTNETSRFPDGGGMWTAANRLQLARDAAAGAALLCAGYCFHSAQGKKFLEFGPDHEAAAGAMRDGSLSVSMECQPGQYKHRDDLEPTEILRAYQRGNDNRCIVRIHKDSASNEASLKSTVVIDPQ